MRTSAEIHKDLEMIQAAITEAGDVAEKLSSERAALEGCAACGGMVNVDEIERVDREQGSAERRTVALRKNLERLTAEMQEARKVEAAAAELKVSDAEGDLREFEREAARRALDALAESFVELGVACPDLFAPGWVRTGTKPESPAALVEPLRLLIARVIEPFVDHCDTRGAFQAAMLRAFSREAACQAQATKLRTELAAARNALDAAKRE